MLPLIRSVRHRLSEWWLVRNELRTRSVRDCLEIVSGIGITDVRFIARGGTALVFRGMGASRDDLAIKVPRCEDAEFSLRREGDALALADISSVPRLTWRPSDGRFFVREFVEGDSFDRLVKRGRPASLLPALCEIARSLFPSVHESPLGHFVLRDFKPRNLIRDVTGRLKLIDLGAVRREGADSATRDGFARLGSGKWLFWAPEQLCSAPAVDRRADYFAFGATAFYAVTGRTPFANISADPVAAMRAYRDSFPDVVDALRRAGVNSSFLEACLHPSADERPSTMEALDV